MQSGTSFVGLFGRPSCASNTIRIPGCDNQRRRPSHAKRRRAILRSAQEHEHMEDHHTNLDHETTGIERPPTQANRTDSETLQQPERLVLDDITETGMKEISDIASDAKDNLEDIKRQVEENASKLIAEETEAVLDKYDQKREELLRKVRRDRQIITEEMEQIQRLAENVEGRRKIGKSDTLREKAYFLMSAVFVISALYYGWKGVTDADSDGFRNSAIDAVVAAACTLAFAMEKRKR